MVVWYVLFAISAFVAAYAMVGYPIVLTVIDKCFHPKKHEKDFTYQPTVTYMITAHNEEEVIETKLKNALELDYPVDKFEILVVSDNSTDGTNDIITSFIEQHPGRNMRVYYSVNHMGKLNAQNEAHKTVSNEILVMTDANTMLKKDAIKELVACFTSDDIAYVCGKLVYTNAEENLTSDSESTYWNLELRMRDIESRLQTIANGNGALYACRTSDYVDFDPIRCHDSAMPYYYAMNGRRAIFNPDAVAMEKAGESNEDEFNRKVRMNREYVQLPLRDIKTINVFKHKWFSFIYFGHKTCRHELWLAHLIALISSAVLAWMGSLFGLVTLILQIIAIIMVLLQMKNSVKNRLVRMVGYYGMTVLAQYVALYKGITGQSKPTWEKVDSTR